MCILNPQADKQKKIYLSVVKITKLEDYTALVSAFTP